MVFVISKVRAAQALELCDGVRPGLQVAAAPVEGDGREEEQGLVLVSPAQQLTAVSTPRPRRFPHSCRLPKYSCQFIEMCLMVTADHGPAVSGAHNTIICARAGKDLVSSLTSGLLTIVSTVILGGAQQGCWALAPCCLATARSWKEPWRGKPVLGLFRACQTGLQSGRRLTAQGSMGLLFLQGDRFGGALDAAAKMFSKAFDSGIIPMEFVNKMKKEGKLIMGIGHRVKSVGGSP